MESRQTLVATVLLLTLAGCINPVKPEISALNPSLPFNKAMDAAIQKDKFLNTNFRPGFHRAADGGVESYAPNPDEYGGATLEHLVLLTKRWCAHNGGRVDSYAEIPVLQRGVGNVVRQRDNAPVVGTAYNLVCNRGSEALAATALGRSTYFMNAAQFRQAVREAGGPSLR